MSEQQHYCPRCKAPIQVGQPACASCGLPLDASSIQAFYQHQQQVYVQPAPPPRKSTAGRTAAILGVAAVVIIGFCAVAASMSNRGNTSTASLSASGTPKPTATVRAAPPLAEMIANKEKFTDAQWDLYAETIKGSYISGWKGKVSKVDQAGFSNDLYQVVIAMPASSAFDVRFELDPDRALAIPKNSPITFSGTIEEIKCFLTYCPVDLTNATYNLY